MRCRECMRSREVVFTATRYGGGTYRRAGRGYRSTICVDCVRTLLERATPGHMSVGGWSVGQLRVIWLGEMRTDRKRRKP